MKIKKGKSTSKDYNKFIVVGIGASAGGFDAFKKMIEPIPENSGMAYVLVQHLDPSHESQLADLLQKVTDIPVLEISDKIKIEPDHIYIIPRNKVLKAKNGHLRLTPRVSNKTNRRLLPIDLFFQSLAVEYQERAVGVVLSGTAADGTLGLKAIKEIGGHTIAQDEVSAAYIGMPHSAAVAGVADFIIAPEKIARKLREIKEKINSGIVNAKDPDHQEEEGFNQILTLMRLRKGIDFSYYKQPTVRRRIRRRMGLHKIESVPDYLQYLRENKSEQNDLNQDLLIPVTEFFRDPKVFDNLSDTVFAQIKRTKTNKDPIRIWVAGCSTGEEAYSIAICVKEFFGDAWKKVQIFATDISLRAIEKARAGIYLKSEMDGLSQLRIRNHFTKVDNQYRINKSIRDMCVFAVHNFLDDSPFGKLDLISCRNVLIYMQPFLQKRALTNFHYGLVSKGFLLLGKSETASSSPELFNAINKNSKLYSRKELQGKFVPGKNIRGQEYLRKHFAVSESNDMPGDFERKADEIILSKYGPAGVVINESMDIVQFRGVTSNYLEQASGKPSHNLLSMAKSGIAFELRNLIHKVKKDNKRIVKQNVNVQSNGRQNNITIEVIPMHQKEESRYLILFHEDNGTPIKASDGNKKGKRKSDKDEKDLRIKELEKELEQMRKDVRSIMEDQEAVNEELQSTNEELQSSGEELQSMNEELETSKEELQSTNEELTIVNQELLHLNEQVTIARDYSEAIIRTIREPLLVLDNLFRVKTANQSFYDTFQVNEKETLGQLIYDLGNKQWNIPRLQQLLEDLLPKKTVVVDFEVRHNFPHIGERVMLLNAREIKGELDSPKLILVSVVDITERAQALQKQKLFQRELEGKVKQRTMELSISNVELATKNRELVSTNKELEAFTYVSSHDLQEPLRKIQAFASRIIDKEAQNLSDSGKEYFQRIQDAAHRMRKLIDDLLSFAHLNTKEKTFEHISLNTLVEEVLKDLKDIIRVKNARLEIGKMCEANLITFQFYQLMHNLIGNALKFSSPKRKPHIKIMSEIVSGSSLRDKRLLRKQKYCHISVSDNGIGFKPEFKEKIFEVFQRLHGNDEYTGTGIGLSIVKKIVDNHNGIITATGRLNKGAKFDIYIPV